MKQKKYFGMLEKAVLFGLVFSVLISLTNFDNNCTNLKSNILRLHILANSDSAEDQAIKLKVRDEILKKSGNLFENTNSLETAKKKANDNLKSFINIANGVLKDYNYKATARLGKSFFETRKYDDFTLPAGVYDSLIITLGEGKGHNWWCVIYPSVCLGSSAEKLSKSVNKKSSYVAEHPKKYKIRFKTVEIYEKVKKKMQG